MNALLRPEMIDAAPGPSFFVWLRDERGFLDSYVTAGDWKHYSPAKLLELVKAAHPSRPVTWCDWAERPGDFTISGSCLLVVCAGEKGTPIPEAKPKRERKSKRRDEEEWDAGGVGGTYKDRIWDAVREGRDGPGPAPSASTEVVIEHCGISFTGATFDELPLLGARDWDEGFTRLHETRRACRCGEELVVITKRLLGGK